MRIASVVVVALLALAGCTEDEVPLGAVDTGTVDTAVPDTAKDDTSQPDTAKEAEPDTSPDVAEETITDTGTDTYNACTVVGAACNDANPCGDGQRCYGFGDTGFCAPFMPECGGFLNKMCAGGRTCLRASGSSLGYCATDEEKPCVCGKADAGKVDGC